MTSPDSLADKRTLPERIADHVRSAIFRGEWRPGHQIRQAHLAEALGVSAAPVREALRRLEADGLVTFKPYCGAVVSELSAAEVREIANLRVLLESHALRNVASRLTPEALARSSRLLEQAERDRDATRAAQLVWDHCASLYGLAGQPLLVGLISGLNARARRYQALSEGAADSRGLARRHRDVLSALRESHVERASALLQAAYVEAAESIAARLTRTVPREPAVAD